MPEIKPIYVPDNVKIAYQLRWAMTLFIKGNRPLLESVQQLAPLLESDGIRVLTFRYAEPSMLQLTLSTLPAISPQFIIQRVKGRLWYAWKSFDDVKIEKHYSLRSYGTQERAIVEAYVSDQAAHHPMASSRVSQLFRDVNFADESVHLEQPILIDRSLVWFNLHIVLVHSQRWNNVYQSLVTKSQQMIRRVCRKHDWRLSRCGIVADHIHLSLGANISDSAQDVVLKLMNNLAFVYEMKPVYQFGAYVATFGEYDQRALRRS